MYRLLHHRWSHWEERDPRWNSDTFQFASSSGRAARSGAGKADRIRSVQDGLFDDVSKTLKLFKL